jgi:hypothetical protein
MTSGSGCGDLATSALQCIKESPGACAELLASSPTGATPGRGVDGILVTNMSGGFDNGALKLGSVARTGCTGTWDAQQGVLTIDCGGMGSTQSCVVTLTRTGKACSF